MSYRVRIRKSAAAQITSWNLPDFLLVEIHLRLREQLAQSPTTHLHRVRQPYDGMVYEFSLVDSQNRLCEHVCTFLVVYDQDEQTLIVTNAGYRRQIGI